MKIPGWCTDKEGEWLRKTARQCKGPIVEIGSYKGLSTSYIAKGASEGSFPPIFAIDHFRHMGDDTYHAFLSNMMQIGVLHFMTPIRLSSNEARQIWHSDLEIGFLYIDGDHCYDGCNTDWNMWAPLVKSGGIIALHDAQGRVTQQHGFDHKENAFPGVSRVADEKIKGVVNEWGMVDRICWMRKE